MAFIFKSTYLVPSIMAVTSSSSLANGRSSTLSAPKKLEPISVEMVFEGFGGNVRVMNNTQEVLDYIRSKNWQNAALLMMSSGNFDGVNYEELGEEIAFSL
jgi:UDP-N-acetylmuramate: L-alanyl-gamma-D-glutamyl-meso-diaminopimelate ligase